MEISPMTDTVISSATREVVLGLERPFVMIGERINPTGRKVLAAEMAAGNFSRVEADALAQVAAGAHMLDVNAGIPLADEPAILARTVQLVRSEEHTSELQSRLHLVCRLLLEKKKDQINANSSVFTQPAFPVCTPPR